MQTQGYMLAAVGMGWYSDFSMAAEHCIEVESVAVPNPKNRGVYDALFVRYKRICNALAPIYRDKENA